MLVTKFIVSITRKIHTDILKFASRNRKCNNKTLCGKSQNIKEENNILPKCIEYQKKLAKCPKPRNANLCCKKLFSDPVPKCKEKSATDNYQKAYQDVTNHARTILNDVQNESKSKLEQLTKDIEISKNDEQVLLQKYLHDIKKTLQKLLALDPSCGSLKRKSVMFLSHQIRQAFDNVECDIKPQIKRIKNVIENLERDVLANIDRAKALILSCRKCKNPRALAKCIEENANYAEKILDKTSENARVGLNKVEVLQREILEHHKATIIEISQTYRKESDAFLEHLNKCILAARNEKKR